MKTRIAVAIASLLVASMGTAAYAQVQQTTPEQTSPASSPYTSNGNQSLPNNTAPMNNNAPMNNDATQSGRIEQKVKHQLTSHGITATDVNVTFNDGTATLSGTVATQRDIAKARKEAMRVRGVKHVDTSNLQVRAQSYQNQQQ